MGGLQALDVVVGCAFFLGLVSVIASGAVEALSRMLHKRAKDLDHALARLLGDEEQPLQSLCGRLKSARDRMWYVSSVGESNLKAFKATKAFQIAEQNRPPTLLRSKPMPAYIDGSVLRAALTEMPEERRGKSRQSAEGLILAFRTSMKQLSESYKRWATAVLLVVSILICAVGNLSVVSVGQTLWTDDVTRAAVVADIENGKEQPVAATFIDRPPSCPDDGEGTPPANGGSTAEASDQPILRTDSRLGWACNPLTQLSGRGFSGAALLVLGWILTAVLSMLGAKFWFDTAGRAIRLRPDGQSAEASPGTGS